MKIGMIGVGKLGLPLCLAMEQRGHEVVGYDVNPAVAGYLAKRKIPYEEVGAPEALKTTNLRLVELAHLLLTSELVFVAVQTPHHPAYEGTLPIPESRADFDYGTLRTALHAVSTELEKLNIERTEVVISTVLPGTMRRYIMPGLSPKLRLCYSPSFIAMGTAMRDFLYPELVLFGQDNPEALALAKAFFTTITDAPVFATTIENAELIKVAYNTMIGMKIAYANTLMEICHKTPGTDVDAVVDALSLATRRLISPAYMRGGMGDGGGCHPRDNIALSWLARELDLSHDFFFDIMKAREDQTAWLADLIIDAHRKWGLPIVLLGAAFKANVNLVTGSPALLLAHMLRERGYNPTIVDPVVAVNPDYGSSYNGIMPKYPAIYFISTAHDCWRDAVIPDESVLIDPHRKYADLAAPRGDMAKDVCYIPVGGSGTP
jgi:UDPglucose 6-dehydrogenase